MLRKLYQTLQDKTGSALIGTMIFLLCFALVGSMFLEYRQGQIIATDVEEMVRKATVTMAVNNSYNAYTGVRESRSNAYGTLGDGNWADIANTTDLKRQLRKLFQFRSSGGKLTNTNSRGTEFVLDIQRIEYNNELSDSETLLFDVEYQLDIPMRFLGTVITTATVDNTTRVAYNPKY